MLSSNPPTKIPLAFATTGSRRAIPETVAGISTPGQASLDVGFPAITMQSISSGGVPPAGQDFNGILYEITSAIRWAMAGGTYSYDSTFASDSNVSGYPKGALLLKTALTGFWFNTVDGNTTNPDTGGAGWEDLATALGALGGGGTNGGYAGVQVLVGNNVLTNGTAGNQLMVVSGTGGIQTLPVSSTMTNGSTITFVVLTGSATLATQGSDTITSGSSTPSSLVLGAGSLLQLTKYGATFYISGGNTLAAPQYGYTQLSAVTVPASVSGVAGQVTQTLTFTPTVAGVLDITATTNESATAMGQTLTLNGTGVCADIQTPCTHIYTLAAVAGTSYTILQKVLNGNTSTASASLYLRYVFTPF